MSVHIPSLFYNSQTPQEQKDYKIYLSLVCSLSNLFSDSSDPYLYYRAAENVFCKAFNAENLSRSDCSADALKNNIGIGLKTFLHNNGKTLQKIAEFNSDRKTYIHYLDEPEKFVYHISELRNKRIEFTKRTHGIESMIYHCVTREQGVLNLYEMPMHSIDMDSIQLKSSNESSIIFKDKFCEYNFNISKSTLLKRFITNVKTDTITVDILEDPIQLLLQLNSLKSIVSEKQTEYIILPLYAVIKGEKVVPKRSGLNQWNAKGRIRHHNEVYIRIPSWVNKVFNGFFPTRDQSFILQLPDKGKISASVCQDGDKALMSNPNKDLGNWILRKVLRLKEKELLTYKNLTDLGIDSVRIDKIDHSTYDINFVEVGSFTTFEEENKV